jgi:Uncharacterized conserved protein (DUF2276).
MLRALTFELYRLRFRFRAVGAIYFPAYKSGNTVRGAFGSIFRKLVCTPDCRDAKLCEARSACPYARVFEPRATRGEGPSGLGDWPRPFVFRASHLDGRTVGENETFHFDVHIFDVRNPALEYFVRAFEHLAREGLGPGRGLAELIAVDQLNLCGETVARVFDGKGLGNLAEPSTVELAGGEAVQRACVRFVTPTELKSQDQVVARPEFDVLFARLRDRISTLRALYGAGPLEIDFRAMGDRAAAVRLVRCELQHRDVERRSSRSGQRHPLGGFTGEAEYEGNLGEFLPYLRLGQWVGVGRQTVWGKGEIVVY